MDSPSEAPFWKNILRIIGAFFFLLFILFVIIAGAIGGNIICVAILYLLIVFVVTPLIIVGIVRLGEKTIYGARRKLIEFFSHK